MTDPGELRRLRRSALMARIRGADTGPERELRRLLWARGMRYRLHYRTPAGRADLGFPGARSLIAAIVPMATRAVATCVHRRLG